MQVKLTETGWDADLTLTEQTALTPGPGQVCISLEAAGVCHRDLIDRSGRIPFLQLPVTPGHEGVGHITAVGEGVSRWSTGDRVATMHRDACGQCDSCQNHQPSLCQFGAHIFGLTADGTYATALLAPESALYAVPDTMPAPLAAVLHCTFGTAWRALVTVGGLSDGESVLITGANGGVGAAAVQIAARRTDRVTAVVRDAAHTEWLKSLGATTVVVSSDGRFHRQVRGIDLALECVGSPTFNAALRCLRVGGRVSVVGNVTAEPTALNLGHVVVMGKRILGPGGADPADMAALLDEHRRQPFLAVIDAVLPLRDADAAQRRVRAGGLRGRLVLTLESS
jgi:acryloyl-coenzyme A reductase